MTLLTYQNIPCTLGICFASTVAQLGASFGANLVLWKSKQNTHCWQPFRNPCFIDHRTEIPTSSNFSQADATCKRSTHTHTHSLTVETILQDCIRFLCECLLLIILSRLICSYPLSQTLFQHMNLFHHGLMRDERNRWFNSNHLSNSKLSDLDSRNAKPSRLRSLLLLNLVV